MPDKNSNTPPSPLLTVKEVGLRYTKSESAIWSWAKSNYHGFPKPIAIAPRTTRWHLDDLIAWENSFREAA
jgi:predicted DNA-binding transcriptional regulator AlpA